MSKSTRRPQASKSTRYPTTERSWALAVQGAALRAARRGL